MCKRFLFATAMLLCGVCMKISAQEALPPGELTLEQAIAIGIKNNFDVQQSELDMQTAKILWRQAQLNRLPDLNAFVGHGVQQGRSIDPFTNSYINQTLRYANYSANSNTPIFSGFSLHNQVKQQSLAYEASKMDLQQSKDNLTLNVILGYLQILSLEDQLLALENQYELSREQVLRLQTLDSSGAARPFELSDLKGAMAGDEISIINGRNNIETAKINLCQLLNVTYNKNMTIQKISPDQFLIPYTETSEQVYATALEEFAMIRAAYLRKKSAEKWVKATIGMKFPTISFYAGVGSPISSSANNSNFINTTEVISSDYVVVNGTNSPVIKEQNNFYSWKPSYGNQLRNNISTAFSLNLNIPLFNAGRAHNRTKNARIALESSKITETNIRTRLQQNIEQAYLNMTTAEGRHKTLLDQVAAFEESFRAADIRFNEGVVTSVDYLIVKNRRDASQINLIIARYDYVLRTKILDYYQGRNR